MNYCANCGAPIPDNQGSRTCSMCYGDVGHGKDGYYRDWLENMFREQEEAGRIDAKFESRKETL